VRSRPGLLRAGNGRGRGVLRRRGRKRLFGVGEGVDEGNVRGGRGEISTHIPDNANHARTIRIPLQIPLQYFRSLAHIDAFERERRKYEVEDE